MKTSSGPLNLEKPRNGKFAEAPGAFSLATRLNQERFDPGDIMQIEVFIVGYGNITGAKVSVFLSPDIFVAGTSYCLSGLKMSPVEEAGTRYQWGKDKLFFDNGGATIILGGLQLPKWDAATSFFDAVEGRFRNL